MFSSDVMLGILSLIYCSPLLIAGGRTFVIPQNFATQPPPITSPTTSTSTAVTHHTKPNHMRWFVERLLERTRPPRAVCQLAVAYLLSASDAVQNELRTAAEARLRHAAHPPMTLPPPVPYSVSTPRAPDNQLPPPYSAEPSPAPSFVPMGMPIGMPPIQCAQPSSALLDPRRLLLAVMVLAHKFHLDKTWTNKAWAKVSGLEAREVGRCERTVAIALGHRLWAGRV